MNVISDKLRELLLIDSIYKNRKIEAVKVQHYAEAADYRAAEKQNLEFIKLEVGEEVFEKWQVSLDKIHNL